MDSKEGKSTFSEDEIVEIKKVFSMVDRDGSGSIDAFELSKIITDLTKEKPSNDALERFIKKVDGNVDGKKDGKIQWEEFLTALTQWVQSENAGAKRSSRKRSRPQELASPKEARAKLHKKIAAFFVCFKQSNDFETIRSKFQSLDRKSITKGMATDQHRTREKKSQEDTMKLLKKCDAAAKNMSEYATAIYGNDLKKALKATWIVADMLSIVEILPTPEARFKHSETIIRIFSRVKQTIIIPRIVLFLKEVEHPKLQYHAARVLTYYAPGPRIAYTPADSVIHPDKMLHKIEVIRAGALKYLSTLLSMSPSIPVRKQSAIALGAIASYNYKARDEVMKHNVVEKLYKLITRATPIDVLRPVTWALSIFCGHTHDIKNHAPNYKVVGHTGGLEKLNFIIHNRDDPETLLNTCCCMSYLLPGIVLPPSVWKRLCLLIAYPSAALQCVLVRCFSDLIQLDNADIRALLDFGLLKRIKALLKSTSASDYDLRLRTCELVAVLAGEKGYIQDVIGEGLVPTMISLVFNDEFVRWKAMEVIKYVSRGQPSQVRYLVEKQDIVKSLANSLSFFKKYDSVLREVYNYYGPSFNFSFIEDVIEALKNLLTAPQQSESYTNYFDMEILAKLNGVMKSLVTEDSEEMLAWGEQRKSAIPLEIEIKTIMLNIMEMHEKAKTTASAHIAKSVKKMVKEFQALYKKHEIKLKRRQQIERKKKETYMGNAATPTMTQKIFGDIKGGLIVKCFMEGEGDNRKLEVPANCDFRGLTRAVEMKYGRSLTLRYEGVDGEKWTIDSDKELQKALETVSAGVLNLYVIAKFKSGSNYDWKSLDSSSSDTSNFAKMLKELEYETDFKFSDLKALSKQFQRSARKGRFDKAQFVQQLKKSAGGKISDTQAKQLFNSFDKNKNGYVDFREFVIGLSMLMGADLEQRMQLCFDAYDINGDGRIDKYEFSRIVKAAFESTQVVAVEEEMIENLVDKVFNTVDTDIDDCLNFEEFKKAVLSRKIIVDKFWTRGVL